jgi:hypothetical protein
MLEGAMGFARPKETPFQSAVAPERLAPPPARLGTSLPADYFDTPQQAADKARREPTVLRQARQLRGAWRHERYGRLHGE